MENFHLFWFFSNKDLYGSYPAQVQPVFVRSTQTLQ